MHNFIMNHSGFEQVLFWEFDFILTQIFCSGERLGLKSLILEGYCGKQNCNKQIESDMKN